MTSLLQPHFYRNQFLNVVLPLFADIKKTSSDLLAFLQRRLKCGVAIQSDSTMLKAFTCTVMQEASDALSKAADSDTASTYLVSSVRLVTDKKLEAFNKA